MNNNEVANPKVEVPATSELNDSDFLALALSCEKGMITNYSIALTEASNESYLQKLFPLFQDSLNMHRELFELTFSKGWYKLESADMNKINTEYNELNQKISEL